MKGGAKVVVGGTAAAVIALCVGLTAWLRVREAGHLSQSCRVRTYGGTNYVVQVVETTVGRTDNGYLLLITARIENPNPYEVALRREWFVLVDHDKDYYEPSTTGTQAELIKLPTHGVLDKETFSFAVSEGTFAGSIGLKIGKDYWVMIKDDRPFDRQLKSGEFVSFRRRRW